MLIAKSQNGVNGLYVMEENVVMDTHIGIVILFYTTRMVVINVHIYMKRKNVLLNLVVSLNPRNDFVQVFFLFCVFFQTETVFRVFPKKMFGLLDKYFFCS